MAETRKVDRRIQRTRALLRTALMELIIEKGYDEITIQDITDQANVARTTFYLHFSDKDELLFGTMRDIYEELYQLAGETIPESFFTDNESDCAAEDFIHVQAYADFYKIMIGEKGSAAFLARVRQFLAESIMELSLKKIIPEGKDSRVPLDMMSYALAGAQIGVIKWWLDNGMKESPHKVAFMLEQLMKKGMVWGLNLEDEIQG